MIDEKKNKFLITSGLFIDAMMSLIVCVTSISLSIILRLYMPPLMSGLFTPISAVGLAAGLLIIRRIRMPALLMIPANLCVTALYLLIANAFIGFFNNTADTVFFIIISFVNFIYSLASYFKPRQGKLKRDGPMALIGIHFLLLVPIYMMEDTETIIFNRFLLVDILVIFFAYFAARQVSEFENGYYYSLRSSMVPVDTIRSQNYWTIILVFLGVVFSAAVVFVLPLNYISQYLTFLIQKFLRALFSLLSKESYAAPKVSNSGVDYPTVEQGATATTNAIYMVVLLIIAFIGLFILVYGIKIVVGGLLTDRKTTAKSEYVTDLIEDISAEAKEAKRSRRKHDFGKGYEHEIRKKFYDAARRAIKHGASINLSASPTEISQIIQDVDNKDISELKQKYEEVRYNVDQRE
ncbi:MAG: hypothetical protein MJ153_07515 [Clostridia bacterium]|nr:hypothetical protein [Clostridia bacterium]